MRDKKSNESHDYVCYEHEIPNAYDKLKHSKVLEFSILSQVSEFNKCDIHQNEWEEWLFPYLPIPPRSTSRPLILVLTTIPWIVKFYIKQEFTQAATVSILKEIEFSIVTFLIAKRL